MRPSADCNPLEQLLTVGVRLPTLLLLVALLADPAISAVRRRSSTRRAPCLPSFPPSPALNPVAPACRCRTLSPASLPAQRSRASRWTLTRAARRACAAASRPSPCLPVSAPSSCAPDPPDTPDELLHRRAGYLGSSFIGAAMVVCGCASARCVCGLSRRWPDRLLSLASSRHQRGALAPSSRSSPRRTNVLTHAASSPFQSKTACIVLAFFFLLTLWWARRSWIAYATIAFTVILLAVFWLVAHSVRPSPIGSSSALHTIPG